MDQLTDRVEMLEHRADNSDEQRAQIESRLLGKLSDIEQAIEHMSCAQVEAIENLTAMLKSQTKRNDLQDGDLERVKEQIHQIMQEWLSSKKVKAAGGVAGISGIVALVVEIALRYFGG